MTLEDAIRSAFASGHDRIMLRVLRRAADGTPEAFQCHVQSEADHRLKSLMGTRADPIAALTAALSDGTPAAPVEDIFG